MHSAASPGALSINVVRALVDRGSEPRLAMQGSSMSPLLCASMVLQLERRTPRFGDVVVVAAAERFVAHRFVARKRDGTLILAGDNIAGRYDFISPRDVVGVVKAVWSGAGSDAKRVDDNFHRLRGFFIACRRGASARIDMARYEASGLARRLNPLVRARPYVALFRAMAAVVQADGEALRQAVTAVDQHVLADMVSRHLCGPILIDGLEALGVAGTLSGEYVDALRKDRWATAARSRSLRLQVETIARACNAANVIPVLLKGASRVFAGQRDSDRYDSDDIDILLPRDRLEAVTDALHVLGYQEHEEKIAYYAPLHHTAPLFPTKTTGVPIELHHVLAPPEDVHIPTDYETLADRCRLAGEPGRQVLLLDTFASALHSLIHARERTTLRNFVILAYQLRELSEADRSELAAIAGQDELQKHRLHAALFAASWIAGLPFDPSPEARRIVAWRLRQYDLPAALSIRSDAIEWFVATSGRAVGKIVRECLPSENEAEKAAGQPSRAARYALKLPVKIGLVVATAIFSALLPAAGFRLRPSIERRDETQSDKIL